MEDVGLRHDVEICAHPLIPSHCLQAGLLVMLRSLVSTTHVHIRATTCADSQLQYPAYGRRIFVWRFQSLRNLYLSGKLLTFYFSLNQRAMKGNDC